VVHHDPYDPHAAEGLDGLKRSIELNRAAFPDMRITVEDQVADGDRVATRWTATMTHSGKLGSAEPTGKKIEMRGITIERFEDGRVVESWRSMDTLGLLRQIGAIDS
jgi:predicted ester cyclase